MSLDSIKMIPIPAGKYSMGSTDKLMGKMHPVVAMEISKPFSISQFLITQPQWSAVMKAKPWKEVNTEEGERMPAVGISWFDAQEFVKRASKLLNKKVALPTEAQWEYCCRAGTTSTYFWGEDDNNAETYGWFHRTGEYGHIKPVGLLKPNPWGLYDMVGNVEEWVRDRCDIDGPYFVKGYYPKKAVDFCGIAGELGIARGGSYRDGLYSLKSYRKQIYPLEHTAELGFRIVMEA